MISEINILQDLQYFINYEITPLYVEKRRNPFYMQKSRKMCKITFLLMPYYMNKHINHFKTTSDITINIEISPMPLLSNEYSIN